MRISLLITALASAGLVGGILPWLGRRRKRGPRLRVSGVHHSRGAHLRLSAPNACVLEHLCRSITVILWARPGLRQVSIDLTHIPALDPSSAASLQYALRELQKAGVEVDVEGAGNRTAQILVQERPPTADAASPEARPADPRRTLH